MKKLIIGLGSGRCGTVSLYRLLNFQKDSSFNHESRPIVPWIFNKKIIDNKLEILLNKNKKYVGDVSSSYLNYVEYILKKVPSARFVVLKRNREEVITSFMKNTKWLNVNFWKSPKKQKFGLVKEYYEMHPKYDLDSKEEALGKYWDDYYNQVDVLIKKYPSNVKLFNTASLNSKEGIEKILSFCKIEKGDRKVIPNIQENKNSKPFSRLLKYFFWRANKL